MAGIVTLHNAYDIGRNSRSNRRLRLELQGLERKKVIKDVDDMLMPAVKVTTRTGLSVFAIVSTRQYEKVQKACESFLRDYPVIYDEYLGK